MSYKTAILNHAPKYWDTTGEEQTVLSNFQEEYKQMAYEARHVVQSPTKSIAKIIRIQNVHDLGQLLIREQLLVVANPEKNYYRVRRFIKLRREYFEKALKYNLDHRRCGMTESELKFHTHIHHAQLRFDDLLVAVQVVTSDPDAAAVTPSNNLEYFIDYVVFFS